MKIHVLWLLLIIPVSVMLGMVINGMLFAGQTYDDSFSEHLQKTHINKDDQSNKTDYDKKPSE